MANAWYGAALYATGATGPAPTASHEIVELKPRDRRRITRRDSVIDAVGRVCEKRYARARLRGLGDEQATEVVRDYLRGLAKSARKYGPHRHKAIQHLLKYWNSDLRRDAVELAISVVPMLPGEERR